MIQGVPRVKLPKKTTYFLNKKCNLNSENCFRKLIEYDLLWLRCHGPESRSLALSPGPWPWVQVPGSESGSLALSWVPGSEYRSLARSPDPWPWVQVCPWVQVSGPESRSLARSLGPWGGTDGEEEEEGEEEGKISAMWWRHRSATPSGPLPKRKKKLFSSIEYNIRGQSKKSESWAVHLLICWMFLLFYSSNMHEWWMIFDISGACSIR